MKKITTLVLVFVMCLSLCACGEKATPEMIEAYNNANACFSQKRYEDAAKLYVQAGDYEDAEQKLLEIYYYAVNCYEQKNFVEAESLFRVLSEAEINDSSQYLSSIGFYGAMENARIEFEENCNIPAAYKWIDVALTYANEGQEVNAIRVAVKAQNTPTEGN